MKETEMTTTDFLVNTLYKLALSMDIMLREADKRIQRESAGSRMKYDKKRMFSQYLEYVKNACIVHDKICQDIYDVEEKNKSFKYLQVWQEEANELARLVLMFADRASSEQKASRVENLINTVEGDGLCTNSLLSVFHLNKPKDE